MKFLFWLAFAMGGCGLAMAADVATDDELYAAYCVGTLNTAKEEFKVIADIPLPQAQEAYRQLLQHFEQHRARFAAYLFARGFGTPSRDITASNGILQANERGRADQIVCSASVKQCFESCRQRSSEVEAIISCMKPCKAEVRFCNSVDRCTQKDNLPF